MPHHNSSHYDVLVGVVRGAHGTVGEVKVAVASDFPERFQQPQAVFIRRGNQGQLMRVTGSRPGPGKGQVILKFEGIDDRDTAQALRGAELHLTEQQLMPLAAGQYYQFQLLGLQVVTTTGESLGPVTEVLRTGANDVYVTDQALIPAIDSVVKQIDLEAGRMIIEPVEGLLD